MRLFRFGPERREKPGALLPDGRRIDTNSVVSDYNEEWFTSGGIEKLGKLLDARTTEWPDVDPHVRIGPCIARPSKIICIGLNYAHHAAESNMDLPNEPVIFMKATSSLAGPYDDVVIPRGSQKLDWEVELAVIVGRKATYIAESEAMDYVAGYCLHSDYSERSISIGARRAVGKRKEL